MIHLDSLEEFEQYFEDSPHVEFIDQMAMDEIEAECDAIESTYSDFEYELMKLDVNDLLFDAFH